MVCMVSVRVGVGIDGVGGLDEVYRILLAA